MGESHIEQETQAMKNQTAKEQLDLSLISSLKPRLFIDGDMYCFLYGDDLMSGVAGFGITANEAAINFRDNWYKPLNKQKSK